MTGAQALVEALASGAEDRPVVVHPLQELNAAGALAKSN